MKMYTPLQYLATERSHRALVIFLFFLIVITVLITACSSKQDDIRNNFQEVCPKPGWWDDVSVEGVKINSYDDLLTYWQNEERTNNQFFKAGYQAILDHPLDNDIVVNAINLLPNGDRGYPNTRQMLEFAVNNYFDYDRPLVNYGGKSGDAIGGIVEDLAGIYNGQSEYLKTIKLIKRIINQRENELNDHMLELLSLKLADAYYNSGNKTKAIETLNYALEKYDGSWEKSLKEKLVKYNND